jgi:hypothetical protein
MESMVNRINDDETGCPPHPTLLGEERELDDSFSFPRRRVG